MRTVRIGVIAFAIVLAVLVPQVGATTILWDNGPVVDPSSGGRCDQGPSGCGGSGTWIYYDNFSLASGAAVSGFTYTDWFFTGGPANYIQTNWSIYAGDPFTTAPIAAGSALASLTPTGPVGQYVFDVGGLSVLLAPGSYWLGVNNAVSGGIETTVVEVAFIDGSKQADTGTYQFDLSQDRAFTVYGDPVPEPTTLVLLGSGLSALVLRRRRDA